MRRYRASDFLLFFRSQRLFRSFVDIWLISVLALLLDLLKRSIREIWETSCIILEIVETHLLLLLFLRLLLLLRFDLIVLLWDFIHLFLLQVIFSSIVSQMWCITTYSKPYILTLDWSNCQSSECYSVARNHLVLWVAILCCLAINIVGEALHIHVMREDKVSNFLFRRSMRLDQIFSKNVYSLSRGFLSFWEACFEFFRKFLIMN
jgi:hypothetical protein